MAEEHGWVGHAWKAHCAVFASSESSIVTFTNQTGVTSRTFFAILAMFTGTYGCIWIFGTLCADCAFFTFVEAFMAWFVQFSDHVPLVRSASSGVAALIAILAKVASLEEWVFRAWHTVVALRTSFVLIASTGDTSSASTASFTLIAVFASWSIWVVEARNTFFAWFAVVTLVTRFD